MNFERVAVNEKQIAMWNLPTRPTKRNGTHAKEFDSEVSVELDALPPDILRGLIGACILQHIPEGEIERLKKIEDLDKETLEAFQMANREGLLE